MNKAVTSKEAILDQSKQIAAREGLRALNIRQLARASGISVGTVYNYFPSKDDLVIATIEAVWLEIMRDSRHHFSPDDFLENIQTLFDSIYQGCQIYPDFLSLHQAGVGEGGRAKGRQLMDKYFDHIRKGLLDSLKADGQVRKEAFSERMTRAAFVDWVFSNLVMTVLSKENNCQLLLEIVKRSVY